MSKGWQVVLAFIGVALFSGVIGAVSVLHFVNIQAAQSRPPPRPEDFGPQMVRRWINPQSNLVSLTPAQRMKIQLIVTETAEDIRRLRREDLHATELMLEQMQDEIGLVLGPDQKMRFEMWAQAQRERMRKFMEQQQQWQLQQRQQQRQDNP